MGSFNTAVEAFGKAHDDIRLLGEHALAIKYIDLVAVAQRAHESGNTVMLGAWADAYLAAVRANNALREAAYKAGLQLSPTKPPSVGPATFIGW